jgi:putative toxin-antitoxin system antitoxin component (TIGR02293 family)
MSYMVDASRVAEVLGVKAKTLTDLSHAVEKGLPKKALSRTAKRVFIERGAARKFLVKVVPEATFKRRVRLTVPESERTERVARVIASAEYTWDDRDQAHQWLNTPHRELDDRSPLQDRINRLGRAPGGDSPRSHFLWPPGLAKLLESPTGGAPYSTERAPS